MGQARRAKESFLDNHPRCCFCAGDVAATEKDHQPGRVFFKNREWPEGFEFPACRNCNRNSSLSEDVVSLLTSHFDDHESRARYRKRVASIRQNQPGLIDSLKLTGNQARRAYARLGMVPAPGDLYSSAPLVKLDPKIWLPHLTMVGQKFGLAMHYMCFGHPLPRTGGILVSVYTNADLVAGHDFNKILSMAPNLVLPTRNTKILGEQFAIRYDSSAELRAGIFVLSIQKKLIFNLLSVENVVSTFGDSPLSNFAGPFQWDEI